MTSLTAADFPAFFDAIWHYPPFDWQARLLTQVHTAGWPSTLDLPTGSGKTATLDIALFALSLDATARPATRRHLHPRRIVLVVDRRTVVDQAHHRALRIADALHTATDGILLHVAHALRSLQSDPDPDALPVLPAILRGGMPRESEWARTPDQPTILISTVDQVGSRLLFRGYGVTDRMKPVHAGLLGRDTLYLLDEVHLSRPFEETLAAVARYAAAGSETEHLPRPLTVVRMSATVAERPPDTFTLATEDREHPLLAPRLHASKLALLREVRTPRDPARARQLLAEACLREVQRLGKGPARQIAVIVNRVDTARRTAQLAKAKLPADWDVRLMTGRMRPLDRADLEAGLLDRIRAGRQRTGDRLLLVSTQAVEAGADFDFDALVTECASLDALRQRCGRLDRMGELRTSQAVILAASADVEDQAPPDPIYGEALRATWRWLHASAASSEEHDGPVVDFGSEALDARLGDLAPAAREPLLAPRPVAPVLVPSHLDRWAQTSPIPSADPDVSPFLHGVGRGSPDVQIVWRADLEPDLLQDRHLDLLRSILVAVPPSSLEALSIPLWSARRWLAAFATPSENGDRRADLPAVADVEGGAAPEDEVPPVMAPVILWRGDETVIASAPEDLGPGDTLVVPAAYGGLDPDFLCWDPSATNTPVTDRGDEAQLVHRARAVVRWHPAVLQSWVRTGGLAAGPDLDPDDLDERGTTAERDAFEDWRSALLAEESIPAWARIVLSAMQRRPQILRLGTEDTPWRAALSPRRLPRSDLQRLARHAGVAGAQQTLESTSEDDGSSFTSVEVPLEAHLAGVRDFAHRFASALALPAGVAGDVALAGWLHDLGKADPRFQLMLHGGDPVAHAVAEDLLLAKSAVPARDRAARERARVRAGYPRGARHELMSVALVSDCASLQARAHDWDLVLHLVASHHGHCRPFAPSVSDPAPLEVEVALDGIGLRASSGHPLARIDSGVAERFWRLMRCYGWWGLAWLEAVMRLADHRQSEQEVGDG